jgi:hypothetical protein
MKVVLIVLILAFFINLTSAFLWFNYQSNEQAKQTTSARRSIFPIQRPDLQQRNQLRNGTNSFRQPVIAFNKNNTNYLPLRRIVHRLRHKVRNTTAVQHQADNINKNSSQIIPQNRFRAIVYRQRNRALNNSSVLHQTNRTLNHTHKQMIHSRFRYRLPKNKTNTNIVNAANRRAFLAALLSRSNIAHSKLNSSSIAKNNIQRFSPGKAVVANTKPSFLRALTTNNNDSPYRQRLLADYYREQLRELYQNSNKQNAEHDHVNANSAWRKRMGLSEIIQSDDIYPVVLVRAESLNEDE